MITCIETLEHIPDNMIADVISNMYRNLKPKGILIICVPTTNRPKEDKHFRHYTKEELIKELKSAGVSFKNTKYEYFWRVGALENYLKLTANRFLYIRPRLIDNILWKKSFKANSENGAHLIAMLEK